MFMVSDHQGELEAGRMEAWWSERYTADSHRLQPPTYASSNNYRAVEEKARKVEADLHESNFHMGLMAS